MVHSWEQDWLCEEIMMVWVSLPSFVMIINSSTSFVTDQDNSLSILRRSHPTVQNIYQPLSSISNTPISDLQSFNLQLFGCATPTALETRLQNALKQRCLDTNSKIRSPKSPATGRIRIRARQLQTALQTSLARE